MHHKAENFIKIKLNMKQDKANRKNMTNSTEAKKTTDVKLT